MRQVDAGKETCGTRGEVCAECAERCNHSRKAVLSVGKTEAEGEQREKPYRQGERNKEFQVSGFAYSKGKEELFIRVHPKALLKAKNRLRVITKRNRGVNARKVMQEIKVYMTGWLNYYGIASLKTRMKEWDEWPRHRIRAYIWKQWKKPKTKMRNLMKLGVPEHYAHMAANSRRGYWFTANTGVVTRGITNERLIRTGFFELSPAYESIQTACIGRAVYRTLRMVR